MRFAPVLIHHNLRAVISPDQTLRYQGRETTANLWERPFALPSSMRVHVTPASKRQMTPLPHVSKETLGTLRSNNRDLKMRGRWRQIKRRLKSEFAVFPSSTRFFHLASLSNVRELSWSWIPKSLIQVKKEKENFVVSCLRPLWNVELGLFTSKSCKDGNRCSKRCDARTKKTYCFFDVVFAFAIVWS